MANCHEMVRAYFPDVKGAVQMHYETQKKTLIEVGLKG